MSKLKVALKICFLNKPLPRDVFTHIFHTINLVKAVYICIIKHQTGVDFSLLLNKEENMEILKKNPPPLSSTFPHALLLPAVHSTWLLLETSFFSASLIFPQNVQRRHQERHGVETDQWQWCVPLQLSHSALPYAIW